MFAGPCVLCDGAYKCLQDRLYFVMEHINVCRTVCTL